MREIVVPLGAAAESPPREPAAPPGQLAKYYRRLAAPEAAAAAFRNARALDHRDPDWPYYLGAIEVGTGDLEAARDSFAAALQEAPDDLAILVRLGRLAVDDRDFEAARERFEAALRVDPESAAALFGLGRAEQGLGRHEAAIGHFEAALAIEPEGTAAHRPLAVSYAETGNAEIAAAHEAEAGEGRFTLDDPRIAALETLSVGAYLHFAEAVRALAAEDLPAAAQADQQALAADPGNVDARLHLALVLARARQIEAAKRELEEVIVRAPDNARARILLGAALMTQGDLAGAATSLEAALAADPRSVDALVALGTLAEQRSDLSDAETRYRRAVELDPGSSENRFQHARVLGKMGRLDEAKAELEALVERDREFGEAILSLGFQLEQAGEIEAALERYRAAAGLGDQPQVQGIAMVRARDLVEGAGEPPATVAASLAMANALARLGRYEEAAETFDRAVELDPASADAHLGRSLSRLFAGQDRRALADLEAGLVALPDDVALTHLLARLLATSSDATVRDGGRALALAERAARAEERVDHVETVAMALAEQGRYEEAAELQRQVASEAQRVGATPLLGAIEERLRLYESGRPVRDVWTPDPAGPAGAAEPPGAP
jgi:tetratricopeptide (TPR) repeat protein